METLRQFIENNIKVVNSYNESLLEFEKINPFLTSNKIGLTKEVYNFLLNNEKIKTILNFIIEQKIIEIKIGKLDEISNNKLLILLIKEYCNNNKIRFEKEYIVPTSRNNKNLYKWELNKNASFSQIEQDILFKRVKNGDQKAREILINNNVRLVLFKVQQYYGLHKHKDDLFQEGMVGLMKAVDTYNPELGIKFSTYSLVVIGRYIKEYLRMMQNPIIYPYNIENEKVKYIKEIKQLSKSLNRVPTIEEIKEETGLEEDKIKIFAQMQQKSISIDTVDENQKEIECIYDENQTKAFNDIIDKITEEEIKEIINNLNLTKNENYVLKMRLGLNENNEVKTLSELAIELNLTRERIRQVYFSAIKKIYADDTALQFAKYSTNEKLAQEIATKLKERYSGKSTLITSSKKFSEQIDTIRNQAERTRVK